MDSKGDEVDVLMVDVVACFDEVVDEDAEVLSHEFYQGSVNLGSNESDICVSL
jgi:hypothetical protein